MWMHDGSGGVDSLLMFPQRRAQCSVCGGWKVR